VITIWYLTSGIRALSLAGIVGYFFFQGRDVFQHLKNTMACHSAHKSTVREEYTHEIREVFNLTFFNTIVTHVSTPSSGSASENTCIQTSLGILKPYIGQTIDRLTAIVPPKTTLEKILSSTCVIR
jgi:hypothetical protein